MPRNLADGEMELSREELDLLDRICEAYYLPAWCSINDYQRIFEAEGLQVIPCSHTLPPQISSPMTEEASAIIGLLGAKSDSDYMQCRNT